MAVTITINEIKELPLAAAVPDAVLQGYIVAINQADTCLDNNNVPDDVQRVLKLNAAWHLVEIGNRGSVKSESSPTGASRSYKEGEGFQSTSYGQLLQSLDIHNCIQNAIRPPGQRLYFRSIGRNQADGNLDGRSITGRVS